MNSMSPEGTVSPALASKILSGSPSGKSLRRAPACTPSSMLNAAAVGK